MWQSPQREMHSLTHEHSPLWSNTAFASQFWPSREVLSCLAFNGYWVIRASIP